MDTILAKLRATDVGKLAGPLERDESRRSFGEFLESGVKFVSSHPKIENVYYRAVHDLMNCVYPSPSGSPMLIEGAVFIGCWLESTGTINTEILSRFCPETAQSCFGLFAEFIRDDGLIPYKITSNGPAYRQIQMVTPLARSVWNHYCLHKDRAFLEKMYAAMARNDAWLAEYRDTMGTGSVEAFCTFDTGHDASPRFWHAPDVPHMADAARCDPDSPILPFLAPDLTANVYCQRKYLRRIAEELGKGDAGWAAKAEQSLCSLMKTCYDAQDRFFYDRDRHGRFVRVQSDVLQRVFACEAGDSAMFADALQRYLLNTRKFFSRYPLTTIALDDPRFFQSIKHNSWSGHISFLSEIRLPHAFEYFGRYVELGWILHPILTALSRFTKFSGSLCPWTGREGYSDNYSPTMLCVLDYVERYCGIYPAPSGELWFTALVPRGIDYGEVVAEETGYAKTVDGVVFELVNGRGDSRVYKDGELLYTVPQGVRLVTGRSGGLKGLIGMSVRTVHGEVQYGGRAIPFTASGNERLEYDGKGFVSVADPGVVLPCYGPPEP